MHAKILRSVCGVAAVLFLMLTWSAPALATAEIRPLPANGVLGTLSLTAMPAIVIDDQPRTLSASGQIRNQKNLIVQTSTLKAQADVKVLYKTNRSGQIDRIWMLTDEEYVRISTGAKAPLPLPGPAPAQTNR